MTRKSYDTRLKYLASEGLLPETYRKITVVYYVWKQEPAEKYIGYELNSNIEELYEVMKVVSEEQRLSIAESETKRDAELIDKEGKRKRNIVQVDKS